MKKLLGGLGLLTLMAFSVFTVPSQAATATKKIVTPMYQYDASKEVTLKGTISSVVKEAHRRNAGRRASYSRDILWDVGCSHRVLRSPRQAPQFFGAGTVGIGRRRQDEREGKRSVHRSHD